MKKLRDGDDNDALDAILEGLLARFGNHRWHRDVSESDTITVLLAGGMKLEISMRIRKMSASARRDENGALISEMS